MCVCVERESAVCVGWCVVGVLLVYVVVCVGVRCCVWLWCVAHTRDHGIHIHVDVHAGVCSFSHEKKRSLEHLLSVMSAFSKPLTFHNRFMFFF